MTGTFTHERLDNDLHVLHESRRRWATLPVARKIGYLRRMNALVVQHAQDWVDVGARFKGFARDSPMVGAEEWLGGPYATVWWINDVTATLTAIDEGRSPLAGARVRTAGNGQTVVRVLPGSIYDRILLNGFELDVWMEPGVGVDDLPATVGTFYRQSDPPGRVSCVLGAGNVSAIPALDTLYSLFVLGDVVVLKMNPVNEAYGPVLEKVFAPLVNDGYVRFAYGAGDVGAYLVGHELVDAVHITGSEKTFDAIVWGGGPEGERRRQQADPLLTKPISSELGGVSPTIVVPGDWTAADIAFQAEHVATQKLHSSGHACIASQVLVLPKNWPLKDEFLAAVRHALADAPDRQPFYPGTQDKIDAFRAANPGAESLSERQSRTLLVGVDPNSDAPCFSEEFFGPMYVTTELGGGTPAEFLRNAVDFANDKLMGNLGANILIDPASARQLGREFESAVNDLRYGAIGINAWSAVAFLAPGAAWGAYSGNTPEDIKSGSGVVHNSLMFDRAQRNVVTGPFRPFPRSARHGALTLAVKPPWFVNNRNATSTARRLTYFTAERKLRQLPGLLVSALRA